MAYAVMAYIAMAYMVPRTYNGTFGAGPFSDARHMPIACKCTPCCTPFRIAEGHDEPCIVMSYTVGAYIVMTHIVMAYIPFRIAEGRDGS